MVCHRLLLQAIGLTLVALFLVGCGAPQATPASDRVATGVAEAKAIAATLTADAPAAPDRVATGVAEAKAIAATLTAETFAAMPIPTPTSGPTRAPRPTRTPQPSHTPETMPTPGPSPTPWPTSALVLPRIEAIATPLWREDDLEPLEDALVYTATLYKRPPFYEGPMPLEFTDGMSSAGVGGMIILYQVFDEWVNLFIYTDPVLRAGGIATGAITVDDSGQLLAEAKLIQVIENEGIEIEEIHYTPDGRVQFTCKSQIDFRDGYKNTETEASGTKERDYYFIWPVSGM